MAVAGRLSEDPSITVAVLEAGMNVEDLPEVVLTQLPRIHYTHRKSRCLFRV
jgi:choline dehydrogenase-like flavoprotein